MAGDTPAEKYPIVWQPSQRFRQTSQMAHFLRYVEEETGQHFADYTALWQWSVDDRAGFWSAFGFSAGGFSPEGFSAGGFSGTGGSSVISSSGAGFSAVGFY